jgi:glutathione-regulated potassium-efflux system ancillary protein KefG
MESMTNHKKALVVFAHPNVTGSRAGRSLRDAVAGLPGVTIHDLYGEYPDFFIDVKREQNLLLNHDLVVLQHPFFWYACPPLLKMWLDDVLELGWAFGENGTHLRGKTLWSVVTTGGARSTYAMEGANRFEMQTFLSPFDQTAHLCGMLYPEPFVLHEVRSLDDVELAQASERYRSAVLRFISSGEGP